MTLLDRHFATRILATFVKAVLAFILLFIIIDLLTHRRVAIAKHDVPWHVVIQYYTVFIPEILYKFQVAALAMLVSGLLVFGSAAQDNEITASLAAGISLPRLVRVPVLVALGLAVLLFGLQETIGIAATRHEQQIVSRFFSNKEHMNRAGVSWPNIGNGWTCHVLTFNRIAYTGEHPFMLAIRDTEVEQIQAERIFWDPDTRQWMLEDGYWVVFDLERNWELKKSTRIRQMPAPITQTPRELLAFEQDPDTKSVARLRTEINRAAQRGMSAAHQRVDLHAKFAQPALSFVMIWLAIPFAIRLRRGGLAIGFGVSIAIALTYLMVFRISMGLGYVGRLSPAFAAWFPNAFFLATGLVLFRKTAT